MNANEVDCLIDCEADIDAKDSAGCSPLHVAADQGSAIAMKTLLQRGADPKSRDNSGRTAIHLAVNDPHVKDVEKVELLLFYGLEAGTVDSKGRTALHLAFYSDAISQHDAMIRKLLDAGIGVNARDNEGYTALACGARGNKSEDKMELLLQNGADVNSRDALGMTSLHWIAKSCDHTTLSVLRWKQTQTSRHNDICFSGRKTTLARLPLSYGADDQLRDECGRKAEEVAAEYGHWAVARLLKHCSRGHGSD